MHSKNRKHPDAKYLGKDTKKCPCLDVPATCRSFSAGSVPVSLVVPSDHFHEMIAAPSLSNTGMPACSSTKDKARPWLAVSEHLISTSPHLSNCLPRGGVIGAIPGAFCASPPLLPTHLILSTLIWGMVLGLVLQSASPCLIRGVSCPFLPSLSPW